MEFVAKGAVSDRHIHYLFKIDPFGMPRLGNLSKYVTRPSLVSAKKHVEKFGKYMRVNCEESKKRSRSANKHGLWDVRGGSRIFSRGGGRIFKNFSKNFVDLFF